MILNLPHISHHRADQMSNFLTAVISAIISGLLSGWAGNALGKKKKEEEVEEKEESATQSAIALRSNEAGSRFGWRAEKVSARMDVINEEGDSVVKRCWRNIKPSEGIQMSHLGGTFWVGTPGGKVSSPPKMSMPSYFPKDVRLNYVKENDKKYRYNVNITGDLTNNDPPLDYDVEADYTGNVLMSEREIKEAYKNDIFKYDYFVFDVNTPIDDISLEVTFPRSVEVDLYPGVFYGDSEVQNDQELQRVSDGFETTPTGARLTVANPLLGFRYFIYWTPPSIAS